MLLNAIPLSCLAAILLVTGVKLVSPALVRRMWGEGRTQFIPFALTVVAIGLTDLLIGVLIGMAAANGFIVASSVHRPLRRIVEKHLGGEVVHIELADQVSFLNRAALVRALDGVPRCGHVLLDARRTDYIDPDLLSLLRFHLEVVSWPLKHKKQELTEKVTKLIADRFGGIGTKPSSITTTTRRTGRSTRPKWGSS